MFESSSVKLGAATVTQTASFPASPTSTTSITVAGGALTIMLRVPYWAPASGSNVSLNGELRLSCALAFLLWICHANLDSIPTVPKARL